MISLLLRMIYYLYSYLDCYCYYSHYLSAWTIATSFSTCPLSACKIIVLVCYPIPLNKLDCFECSCSSRLTSCSFISSMPTGFVTLYFIIVLSTPSLRPRSTSLSIIVYPFCTVASWHSHYDQQPLSTSSPPSHAPCPYKYPTPLPTSQSSPSAKRSAAHNSALAPIYSPSISKSFANDAN